MLNTTLPRLRCPRVSSKKKSSWCRGELSLRHDSATSKVSAKVHEIARGQLECSRCRSRFPILAGVPILVDDVEAYFFNHAKGISQVVGDKGVPAEYRDAYLEAKAELQAEHIEEDLEAERVISLYFMNHYLRTTELSTSEGKPWWAPLSGKGSPLIDSLVRQYWDSGPFAEIERLTATTSGRVIELGCGVGGLHRVLRGAPAGYLGVDSSFGSIALARHLALGAPFPRRVRIPADLLQGTVSREIKFPPPRATTDGNVDFIVGDLESLPVERGAWELSVALNAIDMLQDPAVLPTLQFELLRESGRAIQSCPYIWHEQIAQGLRRRLPPGITESAPAVEWLYRQAGFSIEETMDHVPWLFFKHVRQLEIYSVHLFVARKPASPSR